MTRPARTIRPRRRQTAVRVSLFPFLAVLICTMGALILLLVVIARQARLQADQTAQSEAQRHEEDLQAELEMVQWRIEQLKASRATTEDQLQQIRLLLGHLEDHSRRLRRRLAELQHTREQLRQLGTEGEQKRAELKAEYEAVRAALEAAEEQLEQSRKQLAEKQPAYAIIPYQGPHGTRRRPIYVECREDAVILQPEGVVLVPEDFEGPQGPGNPLAAALRAAREYLLSHTGFDPEQDGEPYPLLLVRPQGVIAYYAAREAMKSWGSEFGYELIDDDWKLAFPRADAELADVMQRAVQSARARQRQLAAAAPRSYGSASRPVFRVSPGTEGVTPDGPAPQTASGGAASHDSGSPGPERSQAELPYDRALAHGGASGATAGTHAAQPSVPFGSMGGGLPTGEARGGSGLIPAPGPQGTGRGGVAAGGNSQGIDPSAGINGSAGPGGSAGRGSSLPFGASGAGPGGASGAFGRGASAPGAHGAGSPGTGTFGSGGSAAGPGSTPPEPGAPAGAASGSGPSGGAHAPGPGSGGPSTAGAGHPAGRPSAGSRAGAGQAPAGHSASGGSGSSSAGAAGPVAGASRGASSGAGGGSGSAGMPGAQVALGGGGAASAGPGNVQEWTGSAGGPSTSLADARGRDWALPGASAGAIAVVRPIRVHCYADRLVLVPEPGLGKSKTIMFPDRTEGAIDEFVSAVWVYMQSWGMAGQGMYWRPVLSVSVAPGAEARFEQLKALLADSGLQVERKTR